MRQVGRGQVWVGVFARTVLVAIMGGAAIGAAVCLVTFGFGYTENPWTAPLVWLLVGAIVGGFFGVLLGLFSGPVIALVAIWWLVPYPGRWRCLAVVRGVALGIVGVLSVLIAGWGTSDWQPGAFIFLGAPSLVGAWFMSPLVIRWYVREMEPKPDQMSALPTPPT